MHMPIHQWPNTILSQNTLLFAQTVKELLDTASFESFRAYALDTPSRIEEAIEVLESIKKGIPRDAFNPVHSELVWSVGNDALLDAKTKKEIDYILQSISDEKSIISESQAKLKFILNKHFKNYKGELENKIISLMKDTTNRHVLRHLTSAYCTRLINMGYSKRYIGDEVDDSFLNKERITPRISSLISFFKKFTESKKIYTISFVVNRDFGRYLSGNGYSIIRLLENAPADLVTIFGTNLTFPQQVIVAKNITAKDQFQAIKSAKEDISSYKAITNLDPSRFVCTWHDEVHIKILKSRNGTLVNINDWESDLRRVNATPTTVNRIKDYSKNIHKKFDEESLERILSSINTLALAINSQNVENRLISLWSSFEVLLSHPHGVRIIHYVRLLNPCICSKHPWLHIINVYEKLFSIYGNSLMQIIAQEPNSDGNTHPHRRFAAILLIPSNQPLRDMLCTLCSTNPLALQRMNYIYRNFSNPKNLLSYVKQHEDRVNWQLHRIYRARNNIVHAGKIPPYLDALIRNAFEYYRSAMVSIVNPSNKAYVQGSVDDAVIEAGLRYQEKKRQLAEMDKAAAWAYDDIKTVFS